MTKLQSTSRESRQSGFATAELSPPAQVVTGEQLQDLRATLQTIAAEDAEFRSALVNDPKGTVSGVVQMNTEGLYEISESLDVIVLEDSSTVLNIVIPAVDKIEGMSGEVADLARALNSDPKIEVALKAFPRETLEAFVQTTESDGFKLPTNREVKVVIEQPNELYIVVPENASQPQDMVSPSEIGAPSKFDPHMSCFTCECFTKASCWTGDCFTASGCFTWSSAGKC